MIVTNVKQALLNHFNVDNRIHPPVQLTDVDFLVPEIWLQGQCNSRVVIQGSAASNEFGGAQTLFFNRRRIEEDLEGVKIPGKPSDYTRFYQVLKVLRDKLGIPVQDAEYLDRAVSGPTVKIDVTVTSMAYMPGSSITLEYED